MKFIYGPIPSRRLGRSLGISPVIKKVCNYSCIYCQLGNTDKMTNERTEFFSVLDILKELEETLKTGIEYDVISIVGEGEPTLYSELGILINEIKKMTDKPVCVITNGATLSNPQVRQDLMHADICLPSLDAFDANSFKKINRPIKSLEYEVVLQGLIDFSNIYQGEIWLEIMLLNGYNDSSTALKKFKEILKKIKYKKLYINSPVRPPADLKAKMSDKKTLEKFTQELNAISIDLLSEEQFYSAIDDDYEAVLSIIRRHPMNQHELQRFLENRKSDKFSEIIKQLVDNPEIIKIEYKGYETYRFK